MRQNRENGGTSSVSILNRRSTRPQSRSGRNDPRNGRKVPSVTSETRLPVKDKWRKQGDRRPTCKPGFVSRPYLRGGKSRATVISLVAQLPARSSSLPESRNGPDRPCSHIWPCSRWGLPSQPVARLLVGSYIKGLTSPHLFTLT